MSQEEKGINNPDTREPKLNLQLHILGTSSGLQIPVDVTGFNHSKNALVGVFDFLGFKRMMSSSQDLLNTGGRVKQIISLVKGCGEARNKFEFNGKISKLVPKVIQVSDTFVVYTIEREPQDVIQFVWNVHHMLFYSILYEFPIRGTLATGEILINEEQNIFLGPAILEAFQLEKQQDWSGACIAPSLQLYIEEIGILDLLFPLVLPYEVPLKEKAINTKVELAVNWIADVANFIAPDWIQTKFPPFKPGSPEENKVRNTEKFLTFAMEQKSRHGPYSSPKNRKVILEPDVIQGGRIVRFMLEDDE